VKRSEKGKGVRTIFSRGGKALEWKTVLTPFLPEITPAGRKAVEALKQ
jgi:hypothetical protein